jgi:hypothetical protein
MSESFNPFDEPETKPALNEEWAAKRRIGNILRELTENFVTCTTSAEELHQLADLLESLPAKLLNAPRLLGRNAYVEIDDGKRHGDRGYLGYELNPVGGHSNPIAPPLSVHIENDVAYGSANLGWQYEGPPNCVHGGWVAALFDQFLGVAQAITKQPGVTGTLSTTFHKPTPLCTDLKFIGRVVSIEGRKNKLRGELWAGDILTATSEGLFISISVERFRSLIERKV